MSIPRPEHPNPQWERKHWRNLNGEWEFDFDFSNSALDRKLYQGGGLPQTITVPFCPESDLSGIGYKDFMLAVCYRKVVTLKEEDLTGRVFLHFGAVDFKATVYVNGEYADTHIGGYASFKIDVTKLVRPGENVIFVHAYDNTRSNTQPVGKQCYQYQSTGCHYTRTTGIWQTVWLEFVPDSYIKSCKYFPDIDNACLNVEGEIVGTGTLTLEATYEGRPMAKAQVKVQNGVFYAHLPLKELHLWEVGQGRLYDLKLTFGQDVVASYFGMRKVHLEGLKFMLNNRPLFLRTVLDQGFYPDGIYTAKEDDAFQRDIDLAKTCGFDGARLHQKVFEKRFLYHADREGYLVWGEHANWFIDYKGAVGAENFLCEWAEILERDFNSPALIGWCPINETWGYKERESDTRIIETAYKMTKLYDRTRPCVDASGNYHIDKKEIHDVHDYEQDPEKFREYYAHIDEGIVDDQIGRKERNSQPYFGEPIYVSEYGGIRWSEGEGWGYGNAPKTVEEFVDRYCRLTDILIQNPSIMGLCYTQLYDVEQEQNGLYRYDRTPKFSDAVMAKLKETMTQKAAMEE